MRERRHAGHRSGGRQRAGCDGALGDEAGEAVEHERLGSGSQPRRRRCGHAVERGLVERHGREPERDAPGRQVRRRPERLQACGAIGDRSASAGKPGCTRACIAPSRKKPSNENAPVRVLSPGDGGAVSQSNDASSNATAGNLNVTGQSADQAQTGGSCKCGSGLQVIGQFADNEQEPRRLSPRRSRRSRRTTNAPRSGSQPRQRRSRLAVERGVVERDGRERERNEADCRSGAGRGSGHAGRSARLRRTRKARSLSG